MTPATPSQAAAAVVQQADTIATAQAEAIRRAWERNVQMRRVLVSPAGYACECGAMTDIECGEMPSRHCGMWDVEDPADTRMADAFREPED